MIDAKAEINRDLPTVDEETNATPNSFADIPEVLEILSALVLVKKKPAEEKRATLNRPFERERRNKEMSEKN